MVCPCNFTSTKSRESIMSIFNSWLVCLAQEAVADSWIFLTSEPSRILIRRAWPWEFQITVWELPEVICIIEIRRAFVVIVLFQGCLVISLVVFKSFLKYLCKLIQSQPPRFNCCRWWAGAEEAKATAWSPREISKTNTGVLWGRIEFYFNYIAWEMFSQCIFCRIRWP